MILAALFCKSARHPDTRTIRFITHNGGDCYCQIVRCKIGRLRHVAFLNVAGSPHHPTCSVEGLASSAFRDMGAPAASLVFWEVDRHEWDDRITVHRVEFASFVAGKFSGPKWIPEAMPSTLARQVASAQHEGFLNWKTTTPGGRR